jgi:hypothetical protein
LATCVNARGCDCRYPNGNTPHKEQPHHRKRTRANICRGTLDDLNINDVFERCLAVHAVPEDQQHELLRTYQETVLSLQEDDVQAE